MLINNLHMPLAADAALTHLTFYGCAWMLRWTFNEADSDESHPQAAVTVAVN
jgi:hypothetical protein